MPEEPDGGRDVAGEPVVREDEWAELTPAVRRITDDEWAERTSTDSVGDDPRVVTSRGEIDDADHVRAADRSGDGDESDSEDVDGADKSEGAEETENVDESDGADDTTESTDDTDDEWEWSDDDFESVGPTALQESDIADDASEPAVDDASEPTVDESDVATFESEDTDATVVETDETPTPATDPGSTAPETDVEQPLAVHVEEMVKRLAIVIAIAGLASVAVFPVTEDLITIIWNHVLPGGEAIDPRVYHPLELVITQLKVASLAGLVVALPVLVYESYVFMRPGLYKQERRYYLAAVPTSLVLAVLGVVFSYFVVLPYTMDYFQGYTQNTADVAFALGTTFNLILMVMGYLAVVFQIPLFIMLAIMLGVVTRQWLEGRRLLFWGAFAGIAFAFGSIDPTGVVPVLVAITMIVLFEGTLALLRWTGN